MARISGKFDTYLRDLMAQQKRCLYLNLKVESVSYSEERGSCFQPFLIPSLAWKSFLPFLRIEPLLTYQDLYIQFSCHTVFLNSICPRIFTVDCILSTVYQYISCLLPCIVQYCRNTFCLLSISNYLKNKYFCNCPT